jgi:hypothetical protein
VASNTASALGEALDQVFAGRAIELLLASIALISVILAALVSPVAGALVAGGLFVVVVTFVVYILRQRAYFDGPYRVLSSHCTWDLEEPDGKGAVVTKRLEVEFNYEAIALSDHAWGDGDQFAKYVCEYGTPLEPRVRDGRSEYVVISLAAPKKRGEKATLVSHRTIADSFLDDTEWVEFELAQRSKISTIEVRFPAGRKPREVRLRRKSDGRTREVTSSLEPAGARLVFREEVRRTRRDDVLLLTWDW